MDTIKFIDLFCGIGGFHQALKVFNSECVFASDIDESCRKTYKKNYNITPSGDIKKVNIKEIKEFDLICAGFPCQSFSKAGQQKGFDDDRGNLFFSICKIAEYHKPKYMILENVRNLATHDKGKTWKTIRENILELGYNTYDKPLILNPLYFGIPQNRERVFILCKRKDLGELPEKPEIKSSFKKETDLSDIMDESNNKYKIEDKFKVVEKVWNSFIIVLNENNLKIPKFPIWTDWWDSDGEGTSVTKKDKKLSEEENKISIKQRQVQFYNKYTNWIDKNREFYNSNIDILKPWLLESRKENLWKGAVRKFEWQAGDDNLSMNQVLWSPRGSGIRVKKTDYSPTLVAMTSMIPVYGPQSRQLSPRECIRLQSFPDDFIIDEDDNTVYKQAGNAVNVNLVKKCYEFLVLNKDVFKDL